MAMQSLRISENSAQGTSDGKIQLEETITPFDNHRFDEALVSFKIAEVPQVTIFSTSCLETSLGWSS